MTIEDRTRQVVEAYFSAWVAKRVDEALALLAEDLEFRGPTASYQSAAAFRPALAGFAAMTKRARMIELMVSSDRAAMLYDCELPPPVGELRIASFFRVENGEDPLVRNRVRRDGASQTARQKARRIVVPALRPSLRLARLARSHRSQSSGCHRFRAVPSLSAGSAGPSPHLGRSRNSHSPRG
jgi:SnoaL-like protein